MLRLPASIQIYVSVEPCDMRKQFDGLAGLVRNGMQRDPRSGDLYVFRNRRQDMLKLLFFDSQGYCLLAKRLDRGRFRFMLDAEVSESPIRVSAEELACLLSELKLHRK